MIEELLDDPERLESLDSAGLLPTLASSGADIRRTADIAAQLPIELLNGGERPRGVVLAAVGTAVAVGDTVEWLAQPSSAVMVAHRSMAPLPGWVGPLDVVVALSPSGTAAAPLSLAMEATRRGASLLAVCESGSPLAEHALTHRGVHIDPLHGSHSAGVTMWALLTPVLQALRQLHVVPDTLDLLGAADVLDEVAAECRVASAAFVNPAKELALSMSQRIPMVLGDGTLTGVVARRACVMLARRARTPASWGELPNAASQIVACFDGPYAGGPQERDIFADPYLDGPGPDRLGLLLLRDALENTPTDQDVARHNLAQAVLEAATGAGVAGWERSAPLGPPLARLANLMALVDFAATYLALGNGFDPATSPHVRALRDHG